MPGASSPSFIRVVNRKSVLSELRAGGPSRLSQLAQRTGLSRPTVSQVIEELCEMGWAAYVEDGPSRAGPGRPGRLVRFCPEKGYVLGVDVGPHRVLAGVADLNGTLVAMSQKRGAFGKGQRLVRAIRETIVDGLSRGAVEPGCILSAALGTPAVVEDTGRILRGPGLPEWLPSDLDEQLASIVTCPVHLEKDVNLAASAERSWGRSRDAATSIYVLWGERVAAAMLFGDQLHRGASGTAGELGYVTVGRSGPAWADERGLGPFERQVGTSAIARLGREAARDEKSILRALAGGDLGALDARTVFRAADEGDRSALKVVDEVARRFASGFSPVLVFFEPAMVVIGGSVSRAGPALVDAVQRHLDRRTLVKTRLEVSSMDERAVALGGIRLALTDVERRIFPSADLDLDRDGRVPFEGTSVDH
jgi:predicted NBD/HSP70 family sugar kinase